jgi:hypothetical protein
VDTCKILNYDTLYDSIDDYAELAYYAWGLLINN